MRRAYFMVATSDALSSMPILWCEGNNTVLFAMKGVKDIATQVRRSPIDLGLVVAEVHKEL